MSSLPSSSVGIALVGVGMVGTTYVDALANLSQVVHVTGVMGSKPSSGQSFVGTYGKTLSTHSGRVPQIYASLDELLADESIDFVIVATPPHARKELVSRIASAGLPVLMEKPVERTLAAAVDLCELCEICEVPLGIMLQHRVRPSAAALIKFISEGEAGELKAVEISVPWWREQSYYDQPGRGSYVRDGGGVVISQAIHTLDLALQFTGPAKSVMAMCSTTGFHQMEAEDFVSAGIEFDNGAVGSFFGSTASFPGRTEHIILHYQNLTASLTSNLLELQWQDGRTDTIGEQAASGAGADPMAFTSDWHGAVIEDFASIVQNGGLPLITGRSALPVHAVIDALERSGRSGERCAVVRVDPPENA